jgi:DNA-binding response OmpR family regulator
VREFLSALNGEIKRVTSIDRRRSCGGSGRIQAIPRSRSQHQRGRRGRQRQRDAGPMRRQAGWDLVLLDIHMPDRSGSDILRHIQTGHPSVRVLVMSGCRSSNTRSTCCAPGASGYLSKDSAPEELMKAVRTVLVGTALRQRGARGDTGRGSGRRSRQAAARAAFDPRIPDLLQIGGRPRRLGHRQRAQPQRQDREHLSQQDSGEDELHGERRHHVLCVAQRTHSIIAGVRILLHNDLRAGRGRRRARRAIDCGYSKATTITDAMTMAMAQCLESLTGRRLEGVDRAADRGHRQIPDVELVGTADTEAAAVAAVKRDRGCDHSGSASEAGNGLRRHARAWRPRN